MDRLRTALAELPLPPWADAVLLRRLLAVGFLVLAAALALRGDPAGRRSEVMVAARDLPPGHVLGSDDLRAASHETASLPAGTAHSPAALLGATLTGAVHAGEIVTDVRIVGPRLAAVAAKSPDARIVPIRLADNAVAAVLRAGDRVDVVAAEQDPVTGSTNGRPIDPTGRVAVAPHAPVPLATDAAVVLVSGGDGARDSGERVVLVALDASHATAVAAASLRTALTVVFH
ncbi:SAF domain-containing protein [Nocardia sp. NPDC050406]|uniref:SAF domain-containing protein n=1 Tax=Nocardia sp. NPDC050406 TaxID=3364318 RepID=UPI003789E465